MTETTQVSPHTQNFMTDDDDGDGDKLNNESFIKASLTNIEKIPLIPLANYPNAIPTPIIPCSLINTSMHNEAEYIQNYLENEVGPDVLVAIGNRRFECQSFQLMCHSDFMLEKQLKCGDFIELPEDKVTVRGFSLAYEWMISKKPMVRRQFIADVVAAAKYLRMRQLLLQVHYFLDKLDEFTEIGAFFVATELIRLIGYDGEVGVMLQRISRYFLSVVATPEYLHLHFEGIHTLLSSNELAVNNEKEVFYAAIRWLTHDWENRKQHALEIMKVVRFHLMPDKYLISLLEPIGDSNVDRVIAIDGFDETISEECEKQLLLIYDPDQNRALQIYEFLGISKPLLRKFLCHPECPYHKKQPNDVQDQFTFDQFEKFLEQIPKLTADSWRKLEVTSPTNFIPN